MKKICPACGCLEELDAKKSYLSENICGGCYVELGEIINGRCLNKTSTKTIIALLQVSLEELIQLECVDQNLDDQEIIAAKARREKVLSTN